MVYGAPEERTMVETGLYRRGRRAPWEHTISSPPLPGGSKARVRDGGGALLQIVVQASNSGVKVG